MAQNLKGLSYEVCSTDIETIFCTWIICHSFGTCTIIHQQLVSMLRVFMRLVYTPVCDLVKTGV